MSPIKDKYMSLKLKHVSCNFGGSSGPSPFLNILTLNGLSDYDLARGACWQRDVKNEECSSELFENKGAKKVLLRSL
jgi:hypothetical protein